MKDETYTFIQTVKDRRNTARSAKYRKVGSKSHTVTLPSDYLTPAQIKRRNSTVATYTMNQPHTIQELKTWPLDIQREYIQSIIKQYHPTNKALGRMLDRSEQTACTYVGSLGLTNGLRPTRAEVEAFEKFNTPAPDPKPDPVPAETAQDEPTATIAPDDTVYTSLSISFTGTVQELLRSIVTGPLRYTASGVYTFTVTAERRIDR